MTRLLQTVHDRQRKMKVLVDADIILEFFINRGEFVEEAEDLLMRIDGAQQVEAYITSKCLKRIYLELGTQDTNLGEQAVAQIESLFCDRVIEIDCTIREKARTSSLRDFDSAEEVSCATSMNLDAIVTQNPQNFLDSPLPIWSVVDLRDRLLLEKDLAVEALRPRKYQHLDWADPDTHDLSAGVWEYIVRAVRERKIRSFIDRHEVVAHYIFFGSSGQGKSDILCSHGSFQAKTSIQPRQPDVDMSFWDGWGLKDNIESSNTGLMNWFYSQRGKISSNDDESDEL
jgi:PIN domain